MTESAIIQMIKEFTKVTQQINSQLALNDLLSSIINFSRKIINADEVFLVLLDHKSGKLISYSVVGFNHDQLKKKEITRGQGIINWVLENQEIIESNNISQDSRFFKEFDENRIFENKNVLAFPLKRDNRQIGVLELVGQEEFKEIEKLKMEFFAEQVAIALNNRIIIEESQKRVDELKTIYDISQSLAYSELDDNVLDEIIKNIAITLKAERASAAFYDKEQKKIFLRAGYGIPYFIKGKEIDSMEGIIGYVFRNGTPLIISDINQEIVNFNIHYEKKEKEYKTSSFISLPIIYKGIVIGVLSLSDKSNHTSFSAFDYRILSTVANQLAEFYQNQKYKKRKNERRKLEQEIKIAAEIQRKILPQIPPLVNSHRIVSFNKPAKEVGGDFYYYHQIDEKKYVLTIADVSGKGIPSALFMGTARNVLRSELYNQHNPASLLESVNRFIYEDSEAGMFVTLAYFLVDSEKNILFYGSAGHNDQFLIKKNHRVQSLNAKGKPLGILPEAKYEEKEVEFERGDILLLCTDGVTDFLGSGETILGEKKLLKLVNNCESEDPQEVIDNLKEHLRIDKVDSAFIDDVTILAVKF